MADSSFPRSKKGRKWGKQIKFWKSEQLGVGADEGLVRSRLTTDEDDEEARVISTSLSSQYSSAQSSAGSPSNGLAESWSFQDAFASVVQSIEEATLDAQLLREDAQQAIADVVASFEHNSEDEGNSLAGESHHSVGIEGDQITASNGYNSTTQEPNVLNRRQSTANESVDEIARAVHAANGAVIFSQSKSTVSGQGSKSVNSIRSCHNSKTSRNSSLVSSSLHSTEDLSSRVQLVTEFNQVDDTKEQDQNPISRIRSFGSGSLQSFLAGRKKKEKSDSVKKKKGKVFGGSRAKSRAGVDQSGSKNRDSSHSTSTSSVTHEPVVPREGDSALDASIPTMRQKIRREAIVREMMEEDNTSLSVDDTYDETLETYDGTLATDTVESTGGAESDHDIAFQCMEQFGFMFSCDGICQKKLTDTRDVSRGEDVPTGDQSCCGTAAIFGAHQEETLEDITDVQTIETYDDGTLENGTYDDETDDATFDSGTYDDGTCNGTFDNGTFDGTFDNGTYDGTCDTSTDNGTFDMGTLEGASLGTNDDTFDDTLETATDADTFEETLNDESFGYEGDSVLGRQPNSNGRIRSDKSEASSLADQSHIYMMMTKIRREKRQIPKEISEKTAGDCEAGAGYFQRSASACDGKKSHVAIPGNRKKASKVNQEKGILCRIQVSPTSWSETYVESDPTKTNSNHTSIQKQWLRAIGQYIHKQDDEDSSSLSRYSRSKLKRRVAAEEALKRMRLEATRKKKLNR